MSITLDIDSPTKPWCKTNGHHPDGEKVIIGKEEVGLQDFLVLAHYVLTNFDLKPDDPRKQFVDCIKAMREEEGWNGPNSKALRSDRPPIPS